MEQDKVDTVWRTYLLHDKTIYWKTVIHLCNTHSFIKGVILHVHEKS